ncbi:hypothetical protein K493DRAFT_320970 [Basidiobolus meristosporus CBS 931.73]|uniref:Uncharacterized protein n=1 Tax=Basidiobolus meristosporus CBS 931.73 TaxID=1314790 RepID=A0A1Y1X2P8_9FUNG|nr:hypothetical protein K493DRAFT_320970 [Basidiobolus meristosporus CBS 931.73]|eukprot:ORX79945.1 hypothetical protein K493DRAFT_320970 [Basidiobolus meristosporus CBS 931.73]
MAARAGFMKNWYTLEVLPIVGILSMAVGGAAWYVSRLARGSQVVWDRKGNPYPWRSIEQDTNQKLYAVNKEFNKSWSRDRF